MAVTQGPIEFLSAGGPLQEVPEGEFGGADGLIQPENDTRLKGDPDASGGHALDDGSVREKVGDVRGIVTRAGMAPVRGSAAWTGIADAEDVIDPVTGRVAPVSLNKAGGAEGELSDLAPY